MKKEETKNLIDIPMIKPIQLNKNIFKRINKIKKKY